MEIEIYHYHVGALGEQTRSPLCYARLGVDRDSLLDHVMACVRAKPDLFDFLCRPDMATARYVEDAKSRTDHFVAMEEGGKTSRPFRLFTPVGALVSRIRDTMRNAPVSGDRNNNVAGASRILRAVEDAYRAMQHMRGEKSRVTCDLRKLRDSAEILFAVARALRDNPDGQGPSIAKMADDLSGALAEFDRRHGEKPPKAKLKPKPKSRAGKEARK